MQSGGPHHGEGGHEFTEKHSTLSPFVVFFGHDDENLDSTCLGRLLGGKNASTVKLFKICQQTPTLKVPEGFALSTATWDCLITDKVQDNLRSVLAKCTDNLKQAGLLCREIVYKATNSSFLYTTIALAYDKLCRYVNVPCAKVAVRSSATAEDLPGASFAGQHDSFLNVSGIDDVYEAARRAYASVFTDRAICYREEQEFDHLAVKMSVGFQVMIRSDLGASGVLFTCDTESGDPNIVLINASVGLGESIVGGLINPDQFMVHTPTFKQGYRCVLRHVLGDKESKIVYNDSAVHLPNEFLKTITTTAGERQTYCLSDTEVLDLVSDALVIQENYGSSVDIEFATDHQTMYIVQSRAETVASKNRSEPSYVAYNIDVEAARTALKMATGTAVGEKIGTGRTRMVSNKLASCYQEFEEGDVLVTTCTTPDMTPLLKKAAAVITEQGGTTSHASIVCRELGIPAVIGVEHACSLFCSYDDTVTVSCCEGQVGNIYAGAVPFSRTEMNKSEFPKPRTKVLANLGNSALAFQSATRYNENGVGLVRLENVVAAMGGRGVHPMACLQPERLPDDEAELIKKMSHLFDNPADFYLHTLSENLGLIAAAFYPKAVNIRFSDFKSNEYAGLLGGKTFELVEENPFLGFRGASRYANARFEEAFRLEVLAIERIRDVMGLQNVEVMIPFVRTVEEATSVLHLMHSYGLTGDTYSKCVLSYHGASRHIPMPIPRADADKEKKEETLDSMPRDNLVKVNCMVEIPSSVIMIKELSSLFDGFSIGSNDLTQLMLGIDRDSAMFSMNNSILELNPAVLQVIRMAIAGAHAAGKRIGICGEAPARSSDFVSFLVKEGIDYISVNPSSVLPVLKACEKAECSLAAELKRAAQRDFLEEEDELEDMQQVFNQQPTCFIYPRSTNTPTQGDVEVPTHSS